MPPPTPSAEMNRMIESSIRLLVKASAMVNTAKMKTASRMDRRLPIRSASIENATEPIIQPKMLMSKA